MALPLFELPPSTQRDWLVERLARPAPASARDLSDGFRLPGREGAPKPAAVLVPLVNRPQGLTVLFTERSRDLPDHPGQISFPGGRIEPGDGNPGIAALREAEEEVGLPRDRVTLLGRLAEYETVTGYRVTPIVGWVEPPFEIKVLDRPKGRSTRVIITEYDLPRREIQPHDVVVDPDGVVWFSHFGEQFLSKMDPKTGKTTDYPIPVQKPDHPKGTLDL